MAARMRQKRDLLFAQAVSFLAGSGEHVDVAEMLMTFLKREKGLMDTFKELLPCQNEEKTLTGICERYNNSQDKREKKYLLQFVNHYTLPQLQSHGMMLSKWSLEYSRKGKTTWRFVKAKRKSLKSLATRHLVDSICEDASVPAFFSGAARHPVEDDPRRILLMTRRRLALRARARAVCRRSWFYRMVDRKKYVKPFRKTDMCPYCDTLRKLMVAKRHPSSLSMELRHHAYCARRQHSAFLDDCKQAKKEGGDSLVLLVDYKGGTTIGRAPVERDSNIYQRSTVRLCGFVAWFDSNPVFVDHLSDCLAEDSTVSAGLLCKTLLHLAARTDTAESFARIRQISIWSDCGNHFRSKEFAHAALWQVLSLFPHIHEVRLNFFAEKHGKGECDRHFAAVEVFKRSHELHCGPITNVDEFLKVINDRYVEKNALRASQGLGDLRYSFLRYSMEDVQPVLRTAVTVKRMHSTYCLVRNRNSSQNSLQNHVFSDILLPHFEKVRIRTLANRGFSGRAKPVPPPEEPEEKRLLRKRQYQQAFGVISKDEMVPNTPLVASF